MNIFSLKASAVSAVVAMVLASMSTGAVAQSVLDRVIAEKKLVIGTRESQVPYAYVNSAG